MRYLNADQTRAALPMPDAIDAMRQAFSGNAQTPLRVALGGSLVMPGLLDDHMAIKVVSTVPGNPVGLVALFDVSGSPLGILDAPTLTAIRTGAVSGLATDLLAAKQASTLAMLGSGAMAPDQIAAVKAVREIEHLRIWSRSHEKAQTLADRVGGEAISDADEAVKGADVISCATPSKSPLFDDQSVKAGAHVNAVGGFTPEMVEVPGALLARAYVVVDDVEAAASEAGDLIQAHRDPDTTLRELLSERHPEIGDGITVFKSVGVAAQDVAAAHVALDNAERLGLGSVLV
ncbi:MAG: ornithine cyclodeaminase family protein [Acidimicrobiia bacterium]